MHAPHDLTKNYTPVWRCIYCPATPDRLSLGKEHIIPFGLGGRRILPRSSCHSCGRMTGQIEQRLLRGYYAGVRALLGIPPNPRRPNEIPKLLPLRRRIDGKEDQILVPHELYPPFLPLLPFVDEPKILSGATVTGKTRTGLAGNVFEADMHERMKRLGGGSFRAPGFKAGDFFRLLAKIAHSFAVAERGLESFSPLLVESIHGNLGSPDLLFGGKRGAGAPDTSLHDLALEERTVGAKTYLVAHVRLFASFRGPTYYIVVGGL